MKKYKKIATDAELLLGKRIQELRKKHGMSTMQLGKAINKVEQQIVKYEKGDFIPISTLEDIAEALSVPIQKRLIRQISKLRKREIDTKQEQPELSELYTEAFDDED